MLYFFDNWYLIIGFAIFFQTIGGIGNGINNSSSMALLSSYGEKRDDYIAIFEVCGGLGALFGPLFGGLFFYLFGYLGPFLCLGGIMGGFIVFFCFKK